MQRKFKIFYKLVLPFQVCVSRHAQCIHIYAISPEKHGFQAVLLPADKYKSFLQGVSILDVCNQACPKYPHNKFVIYLQYLKENGKNEVDFLLFLECYLAVPRSTLGHSQGDILNNAMLITAFIQVRPKGHWEPHNKVGFLSPAERLAGFEQGTCRF